MKTSKRLLGLVAGLGLAGLLSVSAMAGMWSGLPAATSSPTALNATTLPLTGNETGAFDTNLSGGRNPQTETISVDQLKVYMFGNLGDKTSVTLSASGTAYVSDFGTCNSGRCVLTSQALTTATNGTYTPTVLDSTVSASSIVNCSAQRGTSTAGSPAVLQVLTGTGVFTPVVQQFGSPANGTVKISCTVVN
jgi:hypothetical protein